MSLLNDAYRLVDKLGKTLTLQKIAEGTYDAETGTIAQTTADTTVKGLVTSYKDIERDGTLITAADRKVTITAKNISVIPEISDKILDGSIVYNIMDVAKVEEAGTIVIYTCRVRRI